LRAAIDLAILRRDRGDGSSALAAIERPLAKIIGGQDTEDRRRAAQLLQELCLAKP